MSLPGCILMVRRVVRTKAERALVDIIRCGSMVRESYDGAIGDAPRGVIPFYRSFDVGDSLRRHVYAVIAEGMMSGRQNSA